VSQFVGAAAWLKPRPFKNKGFESASAEGWQFDQVVVWDLFDWVSSLAPGAEAPGYDEHFESESL
jgi:hypothetical protein